MIAGLLEHRAGRSPGVPAELVAARPRLARCAPPMRSYGRPDGRVPAQRSQHDGQERLDRRACPSAARAYLEGHRLDEVECIIADLPGIARGKAVPAAKFARQDYFHLPEFDLLPDHHRRLGRGRRRRRLHRARHDPEARHDHRHRRALDRRLDAAGDPRRLRPKGRADPDCAAQRAQTRGRALPQAGLGAGGGAGDGVLPGRAQPRPGQEDRADDGPLGPPRRRAPGLFDDRGRRVRPGDRRHLRFRRGPGLRDRRHHPGGRRRPARDQPAPRRPGAAGRRGVLLQAADPRGGAAPRLLRHLHGQADRGRARVGDAYPPLGRGSRDRARTSFPGRRAAIPTPSSTSSAGCRPTCPR